MESKKNEWHEKTSDMVHDETSIKGFTGEYRWLSNFYECTVVFEGRTFSSSEAAYQSAKTADNELKNRFAGMTASQSKKYGKTIILRQDWNEMKLKVMDDILFDKFTRNDYLKEKLIATGQRYLEETNWWNDTFWGVCEGKGENKLGKTLMHIREEIQIL